MAGHCYAVRCSATQGRPMQSVFEGTRNVFQASRCSATHSPPELGQAKLSKVFFRERNDSMRRMAMQYRANLTTVFLKGRVQWQKAAQQKSQ